MLSAKFQTIANGLARYFVAQALGRPLISSATFLITLRCNSGCRYCDFPRNKITNELSTEEAISLIRALHKRGLFRLGLSGGEPLLRDDIEKLAAEVRNLGILSSLTTNGYLLEAKAAAGMLFDFVLCGIDGDEKIHDAYRGPGRFKAAVSGLMKLRSLGHKRLGTITPVHRENAASLEEVLRIAEFVGARAFFQPVQLRDGWVGPPFDGYCSPEELRDIFEKIRSWKKHGRPVGNSYGHIELVCSGDTRAMGARCDAGKYFFTILPDGSVIPCCLWPFRGNRRLEPGSIDEVLADLSRQACKGCTIVSYFENTRLLSGCFEALSEAVRWSLQGRWP